MPQRLSARKYIFNNKRRVSVLLFSMALCCVLFYVTNFLLSISVETFGWMLVEQTKRTQFIQLSSQDLEIDSENMEYEKWLVEYKTKNEKLTEKLKNAEGIENAYFCTIRYAEVLAVVGQFSVEVPMLNPKGVEEYMRHMGAELIDGRLPENNDEVILDDKIMKNGSYKIGDKLENYNNITIVGIVKSDYYFAAGINEEDMDNSARIMVLTDGSVEDLVSAVNSVGYSLDRKNVEVYDYKYGRENLQTDVVDAISGAANVTYPVIVIILCISMIVVYVMHLRDRYNEWCLYCSIGFSRKEIYFAVMRELIMTFGAAAVLGAVLSAFLIVVLDNTMVRSLGLICRYWYPDTVLEIGCIFLVILAALQIPIRYALHRIRTIDAIDDDLM